MALKTFINVDAFRTPVSIIALHFFESLERFMRKVLLLVLLAVAAGGGWWAYHRQEAAALPKFVVHSNGRLELNRLDVASL